MKSFIHPGFSRRSFLKNGFGLSTVALSAATTRASSKPTRAATLARRAGSISAMPDGPTRIDVQNNQLLVETRTLTAIIDKGYITSLRSKITGEEFIGAFDVSQSPALQLVYPQGEVVGIDESRFGSITARRFSEQRAQMLFQSWDGDGLLDVTVDPKTGDLVLEPSAFSSRPGVLACRWNLRGTREDLDLVAPFFQGARLKLDDPLIRDSRWPWPLSWEAGLAIIQGKASGFWIHTEDSRYRYKALQVSARVDPPSLGFETEAYGPVEANLSAGGLAWRINVYTGDWREPAGRYRDWYRRAYALEAAERSRKEWIHGLRLALCWCPGEIGILEALAKRVDPRRVFIHYPDWRTDPYDENYPAFRPSEKATAFIARAQSMGFHIMPHFNSIDMDPTHPVYLQVRDFQYRDVEKKQLRGWSWYIGRSIGVPESNANRMGHRNMKVMVKIHPGLSLWRSILAENMLEAVRKLSLEGAFIDVTLVTHNLHNCFVEATTPTEGMKRLIEEIGLLGQGLVVGGEGMNEITAQGLSIAQAHLFKSWHSNAEGLERTGGCPLNEFLFGKLCRTVGYSGLSGRNPAEELRMKIHEEHGAIPTLTIRSAEEIAKPNPAVRRVLEEAGSA